MLEQNIPCPNCKSNILFDVHALLQGVSFSCNQCDAKIQLSEPESKNLVTDSLEEFNKMKMNALKN